MRTPSIAAMTVICRHWRSNCSPPNSSLLSVNCYVNEELSTAIMESAKNKYIDYCEGEVDVLSLGVAPERCRHRALR